MARKQITGRQITDEAIDRDKIDESTPGLAVIKKIIAGTNVTITSTGVDDGTGEVTINFAGGGSSAINYSFNVKPAIMLQTILTAMMAVVNPAVVLAFAPAYLVSDNKPALALTASASGSAAKPAQNPALALSQVNHATVTPPQNPAVDMQEVVYELTRRVGGNAVTLSTTNTQGWTNQNNAISGTNGIHDGTSAGFAGNVTAARNGTLQIDYANSVNKTELTITSVILHYYLNVAGTTLNNADVQLKYNIGAGDVTLETITGNVTSISTPRDFDITAAVIAGGNLTTIWGRIDALLTKVVADAALGELWTVTLDAVEVEIVANKTDTL